MLSNYMNDELLRRLVQAPGQSRQLINLYRPLDLYSELSNMNRALLTFLFEIVDIVLCNNEGSILRPIVLVELHHLATHHYYLKAC